MSATSVEAVFEEITSMMGRDPEWHQKMWHALPSFPVVDRAEFSKKRCKDKSILSLGHSGPMARLIEASSRQCVGIDYEVPTTFKIDLDAIPLSLPWVPNVDLIYAGEVLEHLTNPGNLLRSLREKWTNTDMVITVPNAHSISGVEALQKGIECVNKDHVAYYSWHTLERLCQKTGWGVKERYWYNGKPGFAEGLIFVVN